VRRRLLPHQLVALQALYDATTHPTKEQRGTLAVELGLELKAVNVWYQNKRRSMKKQALVWKPENGVGGSQSTRKVASATLKASTSTIQRRSSSFSLDCIASARERKEGTKRNTRPPLTPKRNPQVPNRSRSPDTGGLWEYLPSSSPAPPSSPSAESAFLSALPQRSKTMRSLEWACAKERATRKHRVLESDDDVPALELDAVEAMLEGDCGEDTEVDEAITPNTSIDGFPLIATPGGTSKRATLGK